MITYVVSDLFQSPAQVLVNTVNTVGVMGKGIALDYKRIYPEMFRQYQTFCEKGQFDIGQLWLYKTPHKWILNFPTKKHWRQKSHPEYIEAGLKKFVDTYDQKGITSISFPLLGCGNGELDWETEVRPLMEKYLRPIPIDVYIHFYDRKDPFAPEHRNVQEIQDWLRGEPQALAFTEFQDDLLSIINQKSSFKEINTQHDFRVTSSQDNTVIYIEVKGTPPVEIPEGTLVDLWQHIRSVGFWLPQNSPGNLGDIEPYMISLLSELDYLRPVLLSHPDEINKRVVGLQLIPQLRKTNMLSSAPKIVELA